MTEKLCRWCMKPLEKGDVVLTQIKIIDPKHGKDGLPSGEFMEYEGRGIYYHKRHNIFRSIQ